VTTESGLQYKVIEPGSGESPAATDKVKVHYTGKLINGEVFDSSIQRGTPAEFFVNGVIPGWTEALQLMKPGAKWELFIPGDIAYGPRGNPPIGPNETLLFEVELLEILPAEGTE
jgi:FKBP-type peptidyl-prolyl cis-trans isomerase FklB